MPEHSPLTYRTLRINLNSLTITKEDLDEIFFRTYFGGKGVAAYYLLKETPPGIDPLSPENNLIVCCGPLTGVNFPGTSRYVIAGKSPLTGGFGVSEAGGWWGPELRQAGYEAIIITGKAEKPVYLAIKDGETKLLPADHLWGKTTWDTQTQIHTDLGSNDYRVACIGPGGERGVLFAAILNEAKHANGRTGLGAVMGSKNLKAIAVLGTQDLVTFDPVKVKTMREALIKELHDEMFGQFFGQNGTPGGLIFQNMTDSLPTYNFGESVFEQADKIGAEALKAEFLKKRGTCANCSLACKRVVKGNDTYPIDSQYGGPEYETLASFGSLCGVSDLGIICQANQICNANGIDTISAGSSIAFAMECFEHGLISTADTGGIELHWGNAAGMLAVLNQIIDGVHIGEVLRLGVREAAHQIGAGAEEFAMHVKGQEIPMHEPRTKWGLGLGFALCPSGADHNTATHDSVVGNNTMYLEQLGLTKAVSPEDLGPDKVRLYTYLHFVNSLHDCLVLCNLVAGPMTTLGPRKLGELIEATTGWETGVWELLKAGERSITMARMYNMREGVDSSTDKLPMRFFTKPRNITEENYGKTQNEFEQAVQMYYGMMGWDAQGVPTTGKLLELGIDWLVHPN
jgi:aldehyde:ferredoxin oxidoreductase